MIDKKLSSATLLYKSILEHITKDRGLDCKVYFPKEDSSDINTLNVYNSEDNSTEYSKQPDYDGKLLIIGNLGFSDVSSDSWSSIMEEEVTLHYWDKSFKKNSLVRINIPTSSIKEQVQNYKIDGSPIHTVENSYYKYTLIPIS